MEVCNTKCSSMNRIIPPSKNCPLPNPMRNIEGRREKGIPGSRE
jgi:hypothetical protein